MAEIRKKMPPTMAYPPIVVSEAFGPPAITMKPLPATTEKERASPQARFERGRHHSDGRR
jgi:hypothetical protein